MIKTYTEIRKSCLLVDYRWGLAAGGSLWCEHYVDEQREYFALFSEDSTNPLPITITYKNLE